MIKLPMAKALTDRIRTSMDWLDDDILAAHAAEAWKAMGHKHWQAYTATEFPKYFLSPESRIRKLLNLHEKQAAVASRRSKAPSKTQMDLTLDDVDKAMETMTVIVAGVDKIHEGIDGLEHQPANLRAAAILVDRDVDVLAAQLEMAARLLWESAEALRGKASDQRAVDLTDESLASA